MSVENNYFMVWMVYLAASVGLLGVLWRLCSLYLNTEFRRIMVLCYLAIVWTPAHLEAGSNYWVPAFMATLMEAIAIGPDAAISRAWPILLVMVILLLISIFHPFILRKLKLSR